MSGVRFDKELALSNLTFFCITEILLGTKVVEDRCEQGRNLINVSYLTPGTYLILVESDGKIHLEKMQKK